MVLLLPLLSRTQAVEESADADFLQSVERICGRISQMGILPFFIIQVPSPATVHHHLRTSETQDVLAKPEFDRAC